MSPSLLSLCNASSLWIYENLTKILSVGGGVSELGGNTCFGLTMRLFKELEKIGYKPKLLLGHKKYIKNVHCAISVTDPPLSLPALSAGRDLPPPISSAGLAGGTRCSIDPPLSLPALSAGRDLPPPISSAGLAGGTRCSIDPPLSRPALSAGRDLPPPISSAGLAGGTRCSIDPPLSRPALSASETHGLFNSTEFFLDPGYLIFDPLPIPHNITGATVAIFPLKPNWVKLERDGENLNLWTGVAGEQAKFRFYFPLKEVSQEEFNEAWEQSYYGESMKYLVFNKLDKKTDTQYYYQNGKLLIRTPFGASQEKITPDRRFEVLSKNFGVSKELLELAEGKV